MTLQVLSPYLITDARLSSSSVSEADYAAWSGATAYSAGARVIRTTTHSVYERLITGTTAATPEADTTNWLRVGPTNRWAMLDDSVGSSTTATSSISVTIAPGGPVNDIVLLGVVGTQVQISVNGSVVRTVSVPAAAYGQTGGTVAATGINATGTPSIGVTVTGSGTVAVGTLAMGTLYTLGQAEKGLQIGVQDYSTKTFDDFGAATVTRRGYSRKLSESFTTAPANLDQCARVLTALRSRACIWLGLTWVDSAIVYGFGGDWSLRLDDGVVRGSITLKSLAFGL